MTGSVGWPLGRSESGGMVMDFRLVDAPGFAQDYRGLKNEAVDYIR